MFVLALVGLIVVVIVVAEIVNRRRHAAQGGVDGVVAEPSGDAHGAGTDADDRAKTNGKQ